MAEENEIDTGALQKSIDDSQEEENLDIDQENEESQEQHEDFNLDDALDSFEPIKLEGKVTEEAAAEKAIERGWTKEGKDKYGHSVSAIEFLERTPLFHKMDLMRGDIEDIKKQNKKLTEQSKLIAKKSIDDQKKMLEDFKAEKEELLNTGVLDKDDIDKLKVIDKKIEDHVVAEEKDEMVGRYDEAMTDFRNNNEWYGKNRSMTLLADDLGTKFAKEYFEDKGYMPEPSETFGYVVDEVKKDFPDLGKPKRNTRVTTRNNRTVTTNHSKKSTIQDLPEDMQAVARNVMEAAGLSEEDYMKEYEA